MNKEQMIPHWDLSSVYTGLEADDFRGAVDELRERLTDLRQYLDEQQIARGGRVPADPAALAGVMAGYLERMNDLSALYQTLLYYVYGFVSTDSYNKIAQRIHSELQALGAERETMEVRFRGWMGTVGQQPETLAAVLEREGTPRQHAFYLQETVQQSRYLMSEAEEALAAELALSGALAWQRLQGTICSQLKAPFERDGRVEELPITVIQNLYNDPDGAVRERAYQVELQAWERVREPLAACLNGVKGAVLTIDRRRGRQDALHDALDQARIDRATLETMLEAMQDTFPDFRRYWQAKARRLGKERLPWWDLFAPLGHAERRYTFDQARQFIVETLGGFSERLARFCQSAFERRWIDAEPRNGKRGGAFCMGLPLVEESRILCNFDGSLDQVKTIAHELGHAYHNECRRGKTYLQRQVPMTLAEMASTFNETIILDALLANASDPQEELAVLETFLVDASQIMVDITSRYLFESEVFARRAQAELSADDLCEIMLRCQRATYGDGLDERYLHPYMWAWKPHYYRPSLSFYNFPYAFGMLFSLGLYGLYQQQGRDFLPAYDALLRDSGEATPADLAARFGLSLRERTFWENGLHLIRQRIERYLAL